MYGRSLSLWSGACNGRPSGRGNAMTKGGGCGWRIGGRQKKKRPAAKSLDSLPGRKWSLGAAAGKTDLGTEGGDSGVGICLQLEEAVNKRGTRLSLGRQAMPALVSDPARQLQRRTA